MKHTNKMERQREDNCSVDDERSLSNLNLRQVKTCKQKGKFKSCWQVISLYVLHTFQSRRVLSVWQFLLLWAFSFQDYRLPYCCLFFWFCRSRSNDNFITVHSSTNVISVEYPLTSNGHFVLHFYDTNASNHLERKCFYSSYARILKCHRWLVEP